MNSERASFRRAASPHLAPAMSTRKPSSIRSAAALSPAGPLTATLGLAASSSSVSISATSTTEAGCRRRDRALDLRRDGIPLEVKGRRPQGRAHRLQMPAWPAEGTTQLMTTSNAVAAGVERGKMLGAGHGQARDRVVHRRPRCPCERCAGRAPNRPIRARRSATAHRSTLAAHLAGRRSRGFLADDRQQQVAPVDLGRIEIGRLGAFVEHDDPVAEAEKLVRFRRPDQDCDTLRRRAPGRPGGPRPSRRHRCRASGR